MKIVYLNATAGLGGAERALLTLLKSLCVEKPTWFLYLILPREGLLAEKVRQLGIDVRIVSFPNEIAKMGDSQLAFQGTTSSFLKVIVQISNALPHLISYTWKLRKMLAEINPNLIHTNGFKMHIIGSAACPTQIPVIWHLQDYISRRPFMRLFMKFFQNRCSAIISLSSKVTHDSTILGIKKEKLFTIHNPVDINEFSPKGEAVNLDQFSPTLPNSCQKIKVGFVGTFAKWKGHEIFLRALSLMPRSIPIIGYIIGGPIYETERSQFTLEELNKMATNWEVNDRVAFTGFIEDIASAIRALDIVVHASTQPEPFGLIVAEAMACGKAVIVSSDSGIAEIIEPGKNALVFPSGDVETLAKYIQKLSLDPKLQGQLGECARQTVKDRLEPKKYASEVTNVYQKVLQNSFRV